MACIQPRVARSCEEFFDALLLGNHMDDVIVFPNGLRELGLHDSMPESLANAARRSRTVREFLRAVPTAKLATLKARLYHTKVSRLSCRLGFSPFLDCTMG